MTLTRNTILRSMLGIVISVAAVWLLLRSVDLEAALNVLGSASLGWVGVMLSTVLIEQRRYRVLPSGGCGRAEV